MDKVLKTVLEWILSMISFSTKTSNLSSSLESFSPELYKYSIAILDKANRFYYSGAILCFRVTKDFWES